MTDYNEVIQRVLRDRIYDTLYKRRLDDLKRLFPNESPVGGDRITEKFEVARSSPAAAYTKADVDPSPATNTIVKPYWDKVQYHTACEVENIDINNAKNGGTDVDLVEREIRKETESLMDVAFSAIWTQIKADVDSAATYSDKALSRSTYATLASYEESTDAQVTIAYVRTMINSVLLLKNSGPRSGYVIPMEEAVYNVFNPLAAALGTWTFNDVKAGQAQDMGYQPTKSFDQVPVEVVSGMTTGDLFMLRRQDVKLTEHRSLEIEQVPSGRDSKRFVIRFGINCHVVHPGFQGKMTNKD